MGRYERFVLVLDTQSSELGRAAMRLLELGIDVLYANDLDEAMLLAHQERGRLAAVVAPVALGREVLLAALERLCTGLRAGPRGLVLVGPEPEPASVQTLKDRGVEWGLWEPFDERELRFAVTAAMSTGDHADPRKEVRIPKAIRSAVFTGRHRKEVTIHDLSATGAYLATKRPFLEGTRLTLEIPLPDETLVCKVEVVNAKTADKPGRPDVPDGMGVAFTELSEQAEGALRLHIFEWTQRLRL
jgi:hypothetical protein